MDGDSFDMVERQIAGVRAPDAPNELRAAVLRDVQRELRAARWDRRLGRVAAVMLVVGVGLNAAVARHSNRAQQSHLAAGSTRDSLIHTAVIVAEATDASTARQYARQFAALRGRQLSGEEAAAIDAAVERATPTAGRGNTKGSAMRFRPTKRTWKRLAIGAVMLVAIALIVNGVFGWWVERQLQTRIDATRAAGDPASIAELKPEPIPDERNMAAVFQNIAPRLREFRKADAAFSETPIGKQYDAAGDTIPTAEQAAAMQSVLSQFADVDAAIARAAQCDEYVPMLDYSADSSRFVDEVIEHQQPIRTIARFVDFQMEVDIATGHADRAVERGVQLLRFARIYEKEPTLISYLVSVAVHGVAIGELSDALSAGPVSAELHEKLDAELALHDDPQRLVRALKTEGAMASGWNRWPIFERMISRIAACGISRGGR